MSVKIFMFFYTPRTIGDYILKELNTQLMRSVVDQPIKAF